MTVKIKIKIDNRMKCEKYISMKISSFGRI